jgi:V/A-type H+-transporting ATPase subunit I
MPVERMKKVNIISTSSNRDGILSSLRDCGLVEITELKEAPKFSIPSPATDMKHELAELSGAIDFLENYSKEKKNLIDAIVGYKIPVERDEFLSCKTDFNYKEVIEKCKALSSELLNLQSLLGKLQDERGKLATWKGLDIKLCDLKKSEKVNTALGSIPAKKSSFLLTEISEKIKFSDLKIVSRTKTALNIIIFYHSAEEENLQSLLGSSAFEKVELSACERTPSEELGEIDSLIKRTKEDIAGISAEAMSLLKYKLKLMCAFDSILQNEKDQEAESKGAKTPYLFLIEGWATERSIPGLKDILSKETSEVELVAFGPEEGETPPVAIKNPAHLRPFETITRIFGLPKYTEIDPTAVLSVFFLIFFGMCLSDAGYGFAMIALALYMLKKLQLSPGGKKLLHLLIVGGVATIFIGALTGGWFGVELDAIPGQFAPLKNALLTMQLIDPIRNPLPILGISIGLGVVQVLFGITINMVEKIRRGPAIDGILDEAPWLLFLGSVAIYIVGLVAAPGAASIARYFVFAGIISLVLTQGRKKKNIVMKFLSGVLSLYKSTSYMGDVLSYSRLLALGMSTAIIGMVINILAGMAGSGLPILGLIFMVLILIVGHMFNLLVAIMGAFIHSTRLELVEFFPKFFEGGGKEFKPYKRESKYTLMLEH